MTGMTNPTRFDDDAYNGWSGAFVVEIAKAFSHHGQMIGVWWQEMFTLEGWQG